MGIIDNKKRMLDTIITREGRRQMALGDLRIKFASFTDSDTFYEKSAVSGTTDPSERIFFEATHLPQDQITFQSDETGKLTSFRGSRLESLGGKVLSGSAGSFLEFITGSEFPAAVEELLDSSIKNFEKLYVIRSENAFIDSVDEFEFNTNEIEFTINDASPIPPGVPKRVNVNKIESLFQDRRLSHLPNYRYLPPVNKVSAVDGTSVPLGNFPVLGERITELSYDEIEKELEKKPFQVIEFIQTTQAGNVLGQFFEQSPDEIKKLEVIDFGEFVTDDPDFPSKHVFFVGKLFVDNFGATTFVNVFTLIFE